MNTCFENILKAEMLYEIQLKQLFLNSEILSIVFFTYFQSEKHYKDVMSSFVMGNSHYASIETDSCVF